MKDGPSIAAIAALIGDPARANMLTALLDGGALTATELALEAGVTKQTASSHLAKLLAGGLVGLEIQGRHHYYRLADGDVAGLLERLTGVAARSLPRRTRAGPSEPALKRARVCYDHLAGDLGVGLYDALLQRRFLAARGDTLTLTKRGRQGLTAALGLDIAALEHSARPLCRACLDWSVRRHHLAGGLGAALLSTFIARGWARRRKASRVLEVSHAGETALRRTFGVEARRELR